MNVHGGRMTAANQPTIHVLATSIDGTRAALATAVPLARGSSARLVVLVPQIVPYPLAVDRPTDATCFTERRYRDMVEKTGGEAAIQVCLCRTIRDIERVIPRTTTVVLGGPSGAVLASREERLARRLTRLGYHTVFAAVALGPAAFHAAVIVAIVSLLGAPRAAEAQADGAAPDWQYGGFVDVGYLHAFNDPPNHLFRNRGTAFHLNEWNLNMAGAYVKKKASEQSRWGAETMVQGGKDEEVFGFSATAPNLPAADWLGHFGLLNVSYLAPIGTGLTVQGGVFGSLIGYDSLYAKDNLNYTRPWGADYTPYLMMGVNASYAATEKATVTAFVVNGYWHLANANSVPSFGGQVAYKASPALTIKQTMLTGPHQSNTSFGFWRVLSDTIVERKGERGLAALEYQFSTEAVDAAGAPRAYWMSAQLPLHWNLGGPWSVTVRPEAIWDSAGRWTTAEQTITALTTTLEYRVPYRWANGILRLEYRVDDSRGKDGGFYTASPSSPDGIGLTPTQQLLVLGFIVTFDSPSPR
jgi:hypothetical protein